MMTMPIQDTTTPKGTLRWRFIDSSGFGTRGDPQEIFWEIVARLSFAELPKGGGYSGCDTRLAYFSLNQIDVLRGPRHSPA